MAAGLHALDYLAAPEKHPAAAVCAVFGGEEFLARLVLAELRRQVLGEGEGDFSLTRFAGGSADMRSVVDELSTVAMFGRGQRLVIVEDADDFVSRYRPQLEDYVAAPQPTGVLVLVVKTWTVTTRLAKAVAESGLGIECSSPPPVKLTRWLVARAQTQHGAILKPQAAEALVEILGPELGLLDQQLAKLAVMVSPSEPIDEPLVQDVVAGWRAKTAWDLLDAAASGNAREALKQLDKLLLSGEHPVAILAQIGSTLRRFATATRVVQQTERAGRRVVLRDALQAAGFKPFVLAKAESQLKQLGRQRAGHLHRWLLQADLALKGASAAWPRLILEQLIACMSAAMNPTGRAARG